MKKNFCLMFISMLFAYSSAQHDNDLTGKIVNETDSPLAGASISVNYGEYFTISGSDGYFQIPGGSDSLRISVSYIGYEIFNEWVEKPESSSILEIRLKPGNYYLEGISVVSDIAAMVRKEETIPTEVADRRFISMNRGGSLMSSVNSIPGVSSIDIGSGHSKPLVRGLGFNRVVVMDQGIRHEAQQWGADHGLEIDQYAVDRIEVVKGPASVMYGSDAIGGVIRIHQDAIPAAGTLKGNIEVSAKSNNKLLGGSAFMSGRSSNLFFTTRFTMADYADYRIPADSVEIYSYLVPLHKGRLRNTAGSEMNFHASAGIIKSGFTARLSASRVSSKGGFFANAHGLEPRRVDALVYDRSDRDVLFPSQEVSHFKLTATTRFEKGIYTLESETGFQNNFRQEKNNYVSHGYMPPEFPDNLKSPSYIEREFDKDIFSMNVRNYLRLGKSHNLSIGLNSEYQVNGTGGYAFIIPGFNQLNLGIYIYDKMKLGDMTNLHAGIRFDRVWLETEAYSDWFTTPVTGSSGNQEEQVNLIRAEALDRTFHSLSLSIGLNHTSGPFIFRANAGKGFRTPTAKELGASGVNYHYFRYEKGNSNLKAEDSWQFDVGIEYSRGNAGFHVSPFFSYFPGYIYLNPTYRHDYLYGAGNQIFEYTQNEVMRYGGEMRITYSPLPFLAAELTGEYIYSRQMSGSKKGFTIPFSPAPSASASLNYSPESRGMFQNPFGKLQYELTGRQFLIVPPEKETPGYGLLHLTAGSDITGNNLKFNLSFRIHNLLNKKYLNHVSYYRLIGAPEAGRNFILSVSVPFGN